MFHHLWDFTIRTYLGIWDDVPEKFREVELQGEKFLGMYLRTHIDNTEEDISHAEVVTLLDIMNASAISGKVISLPIIKPLQQGETQIIDIPNIALIRNYKMVGEIPAKKANFVFYMKDKAIREYLDVDNPDAEGSRVMLHSLSSKTDTVLTPMDERMQVTKKVKLNTVLLGSRRTFTADDETIKKISKSVEELYNNEFLSLFKQYASQGVDIYNIGESIYRKYPWFDQSDLFNKIDFFVETSCKIKGISYKMDFNTANKHNQKNITQ